MSPATAARPATQPDLADPASWKPAAQMAAWPQYGYDPGHSGDNPLETKIKGGNVHNLQIVWNDKTIIQPTGIVVTGGVAYVADQDQANGSVFALNAANGKHLWATDVGLNGSWGGFDQGAPAISGNVVVTPCSNKSSSNFKTGICGLNAKTGKKLWSDLCSAGYCGLLTSPAVYQGLAYYQYSDNYFTEYTRAVDPTSGKVAWNNANTPDCKDAGQGGNLPLPAANGDVFAPFDCGGSQHNENGVCAYSAANGATVWCKNLQTQCVSSLFESKGTLFATDTYNTNNLVALNEKTGAVEWSVSLPNVADDYFAVANGSVFINLHNGAGLYAYSAKTGKTLWHQTTVPSYGLSVANGILYTDTDGGNNGDYAIIALNEKTGSVIWKSQAGNGASPATPIILNGSVYAGCYTMCAFTLFSIHGRKG